MPVLFRNGVASAPPRLWTGAVLIALLSYAPTGHAQNSKPEPGQVIVERLQKMLSGLTETAYQAGTKIDESTGSFKADCSGLVGYVLRDLYPEAYLSLRGTEAPWRLRPVSVTYYETLDAAAKEKGTGHWRRVEKLMEVKPGDILAWRREVLEQGKATGHVAVVASDPIAEDDGRVRIRVIDSTRGLHSNDTRSEDNLGVGSGDMFFLMDEDGRPTGFQVRDRGPVSRHPFLFGRIVDMGDQVSADVNFPEDGDFIGLTVDRAEALAAERGLRTRVIVNEGEITPLRLNSSDRRVNFIVKKGKVIRSLRG